MMCASLLLFTVLCVLCFIGRAVGVCPLPPHPANGRHQPQGGDCGGAEQHPACDGTPGTPAPEDWLLSVHCDPGYQPRDPSAVDVPSVCSNGKWSIPQLPPCVIPDLLTNDRERCTLPEPPPNSQYRLLAEECGGANLLPGSAVPHDCIIFLNCNQGYRQLTGNGHFLTHCTNKTWNPNIPQDLCTKAVNTVTSHPPTQVSSSVSPPVIMNMNMSTGCMLPNTSSTRNFCLLSAECRNCDFYHWRCHLPPGSRVDKVKVVCAPDYYTIQNKDISVCVNDMWYPALPKCVKLCPSPESVSEHLLLKCQYGTDPVSCSKPALTGTTVSFQCLPSFSEYPDFKSRGAYRNIISCGPSGDWSTFFPPCKPGCGVSKEAKKFSPTILDGQSAHVGFFPWHAGLYYSQYDDGEIIWDQKCAGSLITDRVIITAAHCVYSVKDVSTLRVALGKYYRSWTIHEPTEQKRNVSEIVFPSQYNSNIFTFDIALIVLSEKIKFGEYIMPVCHDNDEATSHLHTSKLYVVGWGKINTEIGGPSSENLLYNTISVMTEKQCKKELPIYFGAYEKFCALKNNSESTTQKGDSGGGLTAVYDGLHYIIGLVSTKYEKVSIFTNIKYKTHSEWINYNLREFKIKYDSNY